jgi:hypothetical protein
MGRLSGLAMRLRPSAEQRLLDRRMLRGPQLPLLTHDQDFKPLAAQGLTLL